MIFGEEVSEGGRKGESHVLSLGAGRALPFY